MASSLDYGELVQDAMRRVVRDALEYAAEYGLPGQHHFYITFCTAHPGVSMPDVLHARYPREMTIVLQHEFWALDVHDTGFGVTLSFSNSPHRLEVPFEAITVFADPSVQFGLQFKGEDGAAEDEAALEPGDGASVEALPRPPADATPRESDGSADVVTLDRFRKK